MKRFTLGVVCLSGCVLGPACQAIVGIEDRAEAPTLEDASITTDAPTTPSDAATDQDIPALDPDAAPPAGCPTDCLPPAPAGWTGPSAVYDGAESGKPADCPTSYPQRDVDAHQGMTAAPATCECGAPTITGRMCTASVSTWSVSCGVGTQTKIGTATTSQCFVTNTDTGAGYQVGTPSLVPGTCTFPNAKTTLAPPAFQKVDVACSAPQPTACAARADCVAAPFPEAPFGRLCIHKDGEASCPSQDYAVRFVAYKKVEDTRTCTTCSATPAGGACGGSVWVTRIKVTDCNVALAPKSADMNAGQCYSPYPGSGTIIDIGKMAPTAGTCTATGGAASGTAASIEPVTFCCNQ